MLLESFYQRFLVSIESALAGKNWLWKLTFFSVATALFLAFPPYTLIIDHLTAGGTKLDAWLFVEKQAQDLFHPKEMDLDIRRENMIYRWLLPGLSFLTNHNLILILALQALCGILFVHRAGRFVYELSKDKITTALFVISIANIFLVVWIFADIHGYGDGFAYLFLLLALFVPNPLIVFVLLQAAFFTDERAVVAAGYVILWWMVTNAYAQNNFSFRSLLNSAFAGKSPTVLVSWVIYFSIRFYVGITYFPNHHYTTLGTPVLFADAHRNGLGSSMWAVFEGIWLVLGAGLLALILTRRYWVILALAIGFAVLVASGIFVHDIDRAISYGFPFILIAIFVLFKTSSLSSIRLILFFSAIICVSHPQIYYMGYNKILWLEPFPVKVLMFVDQRMGWGMFN